MSLTPPGAIPRSLLFLCAALLAFVFGPITAVRGADLPQPLPSPPSGKVFRVAYIENDTLWYYKKLLQYIRAGLRFYGWDKAVTFPDELHMTLGLSQQEQLRYSARIQRMLSREDYDLLLLAGTRVNIEVQEAPGSEAAKPMIGIAVSDPLAADIVPSLNDSGRDNFTTGLNRNSGAFMMHIFHNLVKFKKLGIMYHDSRSGKASSFVEDALDVGREVGFQVLEYPDLSNSESMEECLTGLKALQAKGADAIFISNLFCVDLDKVDPSPLYGFLESHGIPSFAADDREQVRRFATLGLVPFDMKAVGRFHAEQIIRILSGAIPRDLNMVLPFNFNLLINLESARRVGLQVPLEQLSVADEVYLKEWPSRKKQTNP